MIRFLSLAVLLCFVGLSYPRPAAPTKHEHHDGLAKLLAHPKVLKGAAVNNQNHTIAPVKAEHPLGDAHTVKVGNKNVTLTAHAHVNAKGKIEAVKAHGNGAAQNHHKLYGRTGKGPNGAAQGNCGDDNDMVEIEITDCNKPPIAFTFVGFAFQVGTFNNQPVYFIYWFPIEFIDPNTLGNPQNLQNPQGNVCPNPPACP